MTTKVKVGKETITAIIDSGADINYVNKGWCDKMKIPYKMTGWGWVRSYKGEKTRTRILEASIKTRIQGKFCRARFTVLEETGDDLLVFGDPWLADQNPDIDWKKRTLKFRAEPSAHERIRAPCLRVVDSRTFEHMGSPWKDYSEETITAKRKQEKANELTTIHEDIENEDHAAKEEIRTSELDNSSEVKELEAKKRQEA
jgi:hypothetical protein